MKKILQAAVTVAVLAVLQTRICHATPGTIVFQGILQDNSGNAVSGLKEVDFYLYTSESGGDPVWNQPSRVYFDEKGFFTAELNVQDLQFEQASWLGVNVEGKGELLPRFRVSGSAYSINAGKLGGLDPSYYLDYSNLVNTPAGGGAYFSVKHSDALVSDEVYTLDFSESFSVSNSPPGEINISFDGTGLNADLLDGLDSSSFLSKSGGVMSGNVSMGGTFRVTNMAPPVHKDDAVTKEYADSLAAGEINGNLNMRGFRIVNLAEPEGEDHAATRGYVDRALSAVSTSGSSPYTRVLMNIDPGTAPPDVAILGLDTELNLYVSVHTMPGGWREVNTD